MGQRRPTGELAAGLLARSEPARSAPLTPTPILILAKLASRPVGQSDRPTGKSASGLLARIGTQHAVRRSLQFQILTLAKLASRPVGQSTGQQANRHFASCWPAADISRTVASPRSKTSSLCALISPI
jgi:hypothetical protein